MVDAVTEEELFFPVNRWLAQDKDDGQLHRECPVMSPGVAPVPGQCVCRCGCVGGLCVCVCVCVVSVCVCVCVVSVCVCGGG